MNEKHNGLNGQSLIRDKDKGLRELIESLYDG